VEWTDLARLRAIRIGIVVRSDEPDLKQPLDRRSHRQRAHRSFFSTARRIPTLSVLVASSSRRTVAPGSDDCAPAIICDTWRYRTYETIVPMRNAIWNTGL
jgi:hypothetical protein